MSFITNSKVFRLLVITIRSHLFIGRIPYDVVVARYIAAKLGMTLEVYSYEWDSLIAAVQSGAVDAIAAGMSPTAERAEQVDFTDCYYNSNLVIIYKK